MPRITCLPAEAGIHFLAHSEQQAIARPYRPVNPRAAEEWTQAFAGRRMDGGRKNFFTRSEDVRRDVSKGVCPRGTAFFSALLDFSLFNYEARFAVDSQYFARSGFAG